MFKNWDWEDTWLSLLYGTCLVVIISILLFIHSNKTTIKYSLGESNNFPCIVREIDNYQDETINVDRNIPLDSIVVIIDKLNNTLKTK